MIFFCGLTFIVIAGAYIVALFNLLKEVKECKLEISLPLLWALMVVVGGSILLLTALAYLLAKVAGLL